jgi:hypothetical protein
MSLTTISRASIPSEFFDRTSERLLIAPEPQYLHARLIMAALSMKFDSMSGLSLPIPGRAMQDKGPGYMDLDGMQFELADPIAAEAIQVMPDFQFAQRGMNPPTGHVVRFNRPRFTDSTYTMAVREVPAGTQISTTPIAAASDQVPLVVKRWAGPYSGSQSAVAPIAIDRFDASFSVHSLQSRAALELQRDFQKTINAFGVTLFDSVKTANIVYPDGTTTNDDAVVAGDRPMDWATLLKTQRTLDNLNVPTFSNGRRIYVGTTYQIEQLQRDQEFLLQAKYFEDVNPLLLKSYVKTAGGFDIYKSTTMTTSSNTNSIPIQYGQAFGPGMVGVGPAGMPRVAPSTVDNYGEDPMAIWLWYAAFGVLDNSFGCSIRTS